MRICFFRIIECNSIIGGLKLKIKEIIIMLVLRRLCGQSITIGENAEIIIKVLRNEAGVISIGVDAPISIRVDRLEAYEKFLYRLSSSDRSVLLKRLERFRNQIKKSHPANDSLVSHDLCTS